ncbi:hypothetical protein BAUCODRAFT_30453 [Baudoinia panamericana UAMH 10762]|uniref:Uncharacterized protein n=1 Tax=Baudoinia panamericana (strain UAMH 10762) TaxID=717646 RepID=M2MT25_BAUPA|nr:uncharacterized protein BAUCODRAFT_30453 [Baudoinia panamericana UAMH 10762]EMD00012.1 hypothetical protein BAUCODRAFT_30453 [Baudoinia panamericana UAMH 10762]
MALLTTLDVEALLRETLQIELSNHSRDLDQACPLCTVAIGWDEVLKSLRRLCQR